MINKLNNFLRISAKIICSISIVGVFQGFFHWFIINNLEIIKDYLLSFGSDKILILGFMQLIIAFYAISFNLLFKDWLPFWKSKLNKEMEKK